MIENRPEFSERNRRPPLSGRRLIRWWCALFLLCAAPQLRAELELPASNNLARDEIFATLQTLCSDMTLKWVRVKGRVIVQIVKVKDSTKTSKGCKLLKFLIDSKQVVKIEDSTKVKPGETKADDEDKGVRNGHPGPGTGSTVTINLTTTTSPGDNLAYHDAEQSDKGAIKCPRVIVLAHELIHAAHFADGTTPRDNSQAENETIDGANPPGVGVTENDIRSEQDKANPKGPGAPLGERHGHCGKAK